MLTLSPMMMAPVCRVGDPFQITCIASVEFTRWNVLQADEQGTLVGIINPIQINSRDGSPQITRRLVNSAIFTFMRISTVGTTPLITTLSIDSVSIGLNGTVVHCSDVNKPNDISFNYYPNH